MRLRDDAMRIIVTRALVEYACTASGAPRKNAIAEIIDTYEPSPMQAGTVFLAVSGGDPDVDGRGFGATTREENHDATTAHQ